MYTNFNRLLYTKMKNIESSYKDNREFQFENVGTAKKPMHYLIRLEPTKEEKIFSITC